jgi:hypothetical protein
LDYLLQQRKGLDISPLKSGNPAWYLSYPKAEFESQPEGTVYTRFSKNIIRESSMKIHVTSLHAMTINSKPRILPMVSYQKHEK